MIDLSEQLVSARSSRSKQGRKETSLVISTHDLLEMAGDVSISVQVRRISGALVAAFNDWPTRNLNSLDAFVYELEIEIGPLSKFNVRQKLKNYSPVDDAWKMESLTELLVAWGNDNDDVLLDDLIKRIRRP